MARTGMRNPIDWWPESRSRAIGRWPKPQARGFSHGIHFRVQGKPATKNSGPIGNQERSVLLTGFDGMGILPGCNIILTFTLGIPKTGKQTRPDQDRFVGDIKTSSFHFADC
jgi:hypothetical protein